MISGVLLFGCLVAVGKGLELRSGAYEDLVVKIADNVPQRECTKILENLEETLTSASKYLFSALDSRAYIRSATVLLPSSWPDSCVSSSVLSASGDDSDVTVLPADPNRGQMWTQQTLGCGQPGQQIFMGYESLLSRNGQLARYLIKQFAMYRYGVFEEQGYFNDPIYPMCYHDDQNGQAKVTGCSDLPIKDNGICSTANAEYNRTKMVDQNARSSIMFAAETPSVSMFCDEGNHNRLAPTKHNALCDRRSVLDVITSHRDFQGHSQANYDDHQITNTTPRIVYKKQNVTRYVFVIENSKDMMQRESWSYLRLAMRQWARYVLPENSEIGLVLFDSVKPTRALDLVPARIGDNRDKFYSDIPYTPSESMQAGCLYCSLDEASAMLSDRTRSHGAANNVIVVIATGMTLEDNMRKTLEGLNKNKIKVATINYPNVVRPSTLNHLAMATGGVPYTVFEKKQNVDTTLLTTYFELHNVLYDLVVRFGSQPSASLPVEIHRREITNDGRSSVTGSFMLDPNMGEPAQFTLFTYNNVAPLIKGIKLISPSHQTYDSRNDKLLEFKMITSTATISETGTWTYIVETYSGNPQPHFIQVMATPKSAFDPVVQATFRTHKNTEDSPLILQAEVKYGDLPILGAKVEVTVTKPGVNGSIPLETQLELLDSGSGDPDITRGDGVYTKYFSAAEWGPGLYTFEVVVSDNGNTAYTWTGSKKNENEPCCGSSVTSNGVHPITPFQRVLPKTTIQITSEEIQAANQASVGRIGDLKAEILPADHKARLSWTAPDMGGHSVASYEIRYAHSVLDIMDKFETKATAWEDGRPLPLAPGSETTFTLDMTQRSELLGKTLYFAVKARPRQTSNVTGPISNWARVFVPAPPPPPTVPPTQLYHEQAYWPNNGDAQGGPVTTSIAGAMPVGLELILPVVVGLVLLVAILVLYCYFCVVKRKRREDKGSKKAQVIQKDALSSTITIVPGSPQNVSPSPNQSYDSDPHQVGLPVNNFGYEDDTKKRYSLVNQQEQQLIEELKHQQQLQRDHYGVVSVISNDRQQPILSPYNSWSASQLLHEHETRRRSPMEGNLMEQDHMSLNGHHQVQEHYPPPVPPLPHYGDGRYPVGYDVYGVHQGTMPQEHSIYQSMQRREQFSPSVQGSLSSVNSGEKKRRNVTMV